MTALCGALLMTGCNDTPNTESFVEGEWKLSRIESRDVVIEGEELELTYKGEVIYTFNQDGTASVAISDQVIEGTWATDDDTYVLTCNGLDAEFKQDGDTLVANPDGVLVVLEKNVETIPSEQIPNEVAEEELEVTEESTEEESEEVSEDDSEE